MPRLPGCSAVCYRDFRYHYVEQRSAWRRAHEVSIRVGMPMNWHLQSHRSSKPNRVSGCVGAFLAEWVVMSILGWIVRSRWLGKRERCRYHVIACALPERVQQSDIGCTPLLSQHAGMRSKLPMWWCRLPNASIGACRADTGACGVADAQSCWYAEE